MIAFQNLFPLENRQISLNQTKVKGYHGNIIELFKCRITNKPQIHELLAYLAENFTYDDKVRLANEFLERIDNNNIFHLKVDKQAAYLGKLVISQGDNTILIKIKFIQFVRNVTQIKEKLKTLEIIGA